MSNAIYADYNATVPVQEKHLQKLIQKQVSVGNPSSLHSHGRAAKQLLEDSRVSLARYLNIPRQNLLFTSGATEANNMVVQQFLAKAPKAKVLYSHSEHPSLLNPIESGIQQGLLDGAVVPLKSTGQLDLDQLQILLKQHQPEFVCFTWVNSEVGSINDLTELAQLIQLHSPQTHLHIDGVQALGKITFPKNLADLVDSIAFSAHKIGGLAGVGCIYFKQPKSIAAFLKGGGQEKSLRGGTENLIGIVSFGMRAQFLQENPTWLAHIEPLKNELVECLNQIPGISIHGNASTSVCNTINFSVQNIKGAKLLLMFDMNKISVSMGSACSSLEQKPSRTLIAMGISPESSASAIRISLGYASTQDHVKAIVEVIKRATNSL